MTESEIKGLKSLHSKLSSIKNKIEEQHNKYLEKENKKYITFLRLRALKNLKKSLNKYIKK